MRRRGVRNEANFFSSVCHRSEISLQLRQVEAGREVWIFGFRRQDGVGLVDAFIPPCPRGLLRVSPSQHGYTVLVVGNGENGVAVIRQRAGSPGLVGVELLLAVG